MTSYYNPNCDRYLQRTDDSKSHKLKNAYWTTKQAVIKTLRRKQDENIVASDSDLDAKLELLKSVQSTCRDLDNILARYQRTICYVSQAENEMGRFLKQYSLEDKTQAGKIMSAVGKALSSSAQQRLTLLDPLDRVHQEVKTFRQRAISDTTNTVKHMEQFRTEYRGALLWMKSVSEELDPDTHKQLEKFRCVQAQVRKAKASFDRLKVDSMQKIDLLAASRCNMLSHVLVGYQNTLLTFLEKTSHMMVAVAESFRGYQYYEFSILRHLRPESRKLAGYKTDDDDVDGEKDIDRLDSGGDMNQVELNNSNDNSHGASVHHQSKTMLTNEAELDKRLDEIFSGTNCDQFDFNSEQFKSARNQTSLDGTTEDLLNKSTEQVPADHRDLFNDLFLNNTKDDKFIGQFSGVDSRFFDHQNKNEFMTDLESVFSEVDQTCQNSDFGPLQSAEPKYDQDTFKTPILPSHLLGQDFQDLFSNPGISNSNIITQPMKSSMKNANSLSKNNDSEQLCKRSDTSLGTISNTTKSSSSTSSSSSQKPTNLDAWLNLFSDLGPIGNPDTLSKKTGQVTDA
ncbi:unnamed protein product [Schistosoma turkestanicum]|nr:unnamed protein product [Schistosoma turkestanicum]